eukprot:TRINITY_DN838_c0_g1_i4.p1 TRINITY_DN838_c0_g1~~TRINITY_DN838_c0_g1_i4.p1  ORF type:complete len:552 (+),score=88.26 TRINITY_DN838_c0_g1_i4:182-1837(+)
MSLDSSFYGDFSIGGGYIPLDLLIVDQETAKELQCGICLQLLSKPRQCKNGHLFCEACIRQSLDRNQECPSCRLPLKLEELARSLFVEKHIRNLKIWCKYHFHQPYPTPPTPSSTPPPAQSSSSSSSSSSTSGSVALAPEESIGSASGNGIMGTPGNLSMSSSLPSPSALSWGSAIGSGSSSILSNSTSNLNLFSMSSSNGNSGSSQNVAKTLSTSTPPINGINIGYCATVDPDGCKESHTLENISKHEAACGFSIVGCRWSTQCGRIRRHQAEAHELSCPYRPERCKHCSQDVQLNNMEEHERVLCAMFPVQCPKGCKSGDSPLIIRRGELESHLKNRCPEQEVDCSFSDQGCTKRFLRKDLKPHLAEEVVEHMQLMKRGYDEQLSLLRTDLDNQLKLRDERIRYLEKQVHENETKVEWKVKSFSTLRKKSYLQSDKFSIAGFTWFIGFYTDGDNPDSRGFISIYLFLDVAHLPKGKSITLEYYLRFINHRDPHESVKKDFKTTFPIKGGQGWGDRKALKNSVLEQNGFLKDDVLHIEAEISVKRIAWSV